MRVFLTSSHFSFLALVFSVGTLASTAFTPVVIQRQGPLVGRQVHRLHATKKKKKSKRKSTTAGGGGGIKGFGSIASVVAGADRSKETREFYEKFLEAGGAGDNLKRTRLGLEPTNADFDLRGVICTRDMAKVR